MARNYGSSTTRIILFVMLSLGILLGGGLNLLHTGLDRYWTATHLFRLGVPAEAMVSGKRAYLSTFGMLYVLRFSYAPKGGTADLVSKIEALRQQGYAEDNPLLLAYRQMAALGDGERLAGKSQVSRPLFQQVAKGDTVTVHYDPADPAEVMLDLDHNRSLARLLPSLVVGLVLLLAGVVLLGMVIRLAVLHKRASKQARKDSLHHD